MLNYGNTPELILATACSLQDCSKKLYARSLCKSHYTVQLRRGDIKRVTTRWASCEERFWAKVNFKGDCWLWEAAVNNIGYGRFNVGNRKIKGAHEVSFFFVYGSVSAGLELDHLCRIRHCVNPCHLEAVTHAENVSRGTSVGAVAGQTNKCIRGHSFNEENTYYVNNPDRAIHRQCRECQRIRRGHQRNTISAGSS